ncbi:MAG: hypothetical protein R3B09_26220 [Nannocystaceae bacterium]
MGDPSPRTVVGRALASAASLPWAIAASLSLVVACDPEAPAPTPDGASVAADADVVLTAEIVLLRLYHRLRQVDLDGVAIADAGMVLAQQIPAGLAADLEDPGCMSVLNNGESSLGFTFDDCQHVNVGRLDGAIRVDFAPEAGLCGGDPCVIAVGYTLRLTSLEIRGSRVDTSLASLRVPRELAPALLYTSEATFPGEDDRLLEGRSDASLAYAGGCVTADFGVEVTTPEGSISVGGRGVQSCAGGCPEAGVVQLAWGAGQAVSWEYTGERRLEVEGPRGLHFALAALCASF